jgi:hypothetical protein
MRKLLLLLAYIAALGCEPPSDKTVDYRFQEIVRDRAAIEFPCGWEHVAVAPLKGWAYRAEGCGIVQVYECGFDTGDFGDEDKTLYVCHAQSSAPTQAPKPATPTCNGPDGG